MARYVRLSMWAGKWWSLLCLSLSPLVLGESLSDPTRPEGWGAATVVVEAGERPGVEVNSIVFSGSRRLAMINGQLLKAGQVTGDINLLKIEKDQVVLKWRDEVWTQGVAQSLTIRR